MSMCALKPDFFAWELLYTTIERAIIRKTDVIVALAHFVLLKHGGFRCLGLGEHRNLKPKEVGLELLPEGWNYDSTKYALRYKRGDFLYILLGSKHNNQFKLSLLDVSNEKMANLVLDAEKLVVKIRGAITDLVPQAALIAARIRKELIDVIHASSTCEMLTQTNPDDCKKCENSDDKISEQLKDFKCMQIGDTHAVCAQGNTPNAHS